MILEIPYDLIIPLLGIYPEKTKTLIQKDICTHVIDYCSIIYNSQDIEVTCVYQQINKEDVIHTHVHTIEYYAAIKKDEILPSATTWMDLEDIILN